jgi:hydroxyacylglutathione hydrolase
MKEKHFGPIWFIPGKQGGRYPFCHSVYVEGAGLLIDPASDRERLIQLRDGPGVKGVWLSHWHEDHLMHLDLFDDLPLWVSEPDAPPLTTVDAFMDAYGMDQADERAFWREILVKDFHFRPRLPNGFLTEGTEILMDGLTIEILSTPGHTPGHTAFFFQEQGVPAKVWIAGHETGLFEADPGALWERYLAVISVREEKLLELLKMPRSLDDIVEACIIYGKPREPKAFFEFGERAHMKKHLEKLVRKGIVRMEGERYVRQ